jgi:anti-sigma B factor antagonist
MLHHDKLDINQRDREGLVILDLHGNLIMGKSDSALRDIVQSLFDRDNRRLILNLAQISEIDTTGMESLLFLAEEYRDAKGKLALFNIAHSHGQVYELARLETAIEIYRDELDAVNSFFPDRTPPHYDILDYVESQTHEDQAPKDSSGAAHRISRQTQL